MARAQQPPSETIPTYGYGRTSRNERDTGTASRDVQINAVQPHLGYKMDLAGAFFFDNGVSASIPFSRRPEGGKLISATKGAPCRIVVAKLDRLFRSGRDFYNTVAEWDKQGIQLVSVSEGFDMGTIMGRLVAGILATVAEFERNVIADRIRESFKARRLAGRRYSKEAPYGWKFEPTGKVLPGDRPEVAMVRDANETAWLGKMKVWRFRGLSYRDICARLASEGCMTRHGAPWKAETVRVVVKRALQDLAGGSSSETESTSIEKGKKNGE